MCKKVLILGGTGAIGEQLVQILLSENYKVFVTSRTPHKTDNVNLKYLLGNAHDEKFLKNILNEVYDAIVDFMQYDSIDEFRILLPIKIQSTKQYIFCSSARVYAGKEEILSEDSACLYGITDPIEAYAMNKISQERELLRLKSHNWTIIRPYITYNKERLQLGKFEKEEWLYRAIHNRTIVFPKEILEKVTTMTYAQDVARVVEQLLGNKEAFGNIIQITTSEFMCWRDILEIYLDVLEDKISYRPKVLLYENDIWRLSVDRKQNRKFDSSKVMKMCKVCFTKTEIGLKECLEAFIEEHRNFKKIAWTTQAKMDLLTDEITSLDEIDNNEDRMKYMMIRFGGYIFERKKGDLHKQWKIWAEDYARKDYIYMKNIFETNRKIGIFAVSNIARRITGAYRIANEDKTKKKILLFDSNSLRWGENVDGYIIQEPKDSVLKTLDVMIIASNQYYEEIYREYDYLEKLGIKIVSVKEFFRD